MARRGRQRRDSTAERLATAQTPGYAKNGLSLFSRIAARREPAPQLKGGVPDRSTVSLINFERARLRHLEAQLSSEDNAERRAKLEHNIDIKAAFIARLQRENEDDDSHT